MSGNAEFYWYPDAYPSTFQRVTLPAGASVELTHEGGPDWRLRFTLPGAYGPLSDMLGGSVGSGEVFAFTADNSKMAAGWYPSRTLAAGTAEVPLSGNPWASWGSVDLVLNEGDRAWLRSARGPERQLEEVEEWAAAVATMAGPLPAGHDQGPVLLTWEGFLPFVRLRAGAHPLWSTDPATGEVAYDLPLVESAAALRAAGALASGFEYAVAPGAVLRVGGYTQGLGGL